MAAVSEGAETEILALIGKVLGGADQARSLLGSALPAWGGAEACIDAYEDGIRAATEFQLTSHGHSTSSRRARSPPPT